MTANTSGVEVKTVMMSPHVLRGVVNKSSLLFQINAIAQQQPTAKKDGGEEAIVEQRPPLEVCLCVDRSGSMSGSKLKNAKRACKKVVKHLQPGVDVAHLIMYDDKAQPVFINGDLTNKEALKVAIRALQVRGSTNIEDGLKLSFDIIQQTTTSSTSTAAAAATSTTTVPRTRRIMLFSDGEATTGIQSAGEFREFVGHRTATTGITVSAFGIGEHFDEAVMKGIAESGKGTYAFIKSAEAIPKTISKAIHGLMDMAASNVQLSVRGVNGAVVTKVYGKTEGLPAGVVNLKDLIEGSNKQVLVDLEFGTPVVTAPAIEVPVVEWCLTFVDTKQQKREIRGVAVVVLTEDETLVKEQNQAVLVAKAIQNAALTNQEIALHLTHGRKAEAIKMKNELLHALEAVLPLDTTTRISEIIRRTRTSLESLQKENNLAKARKETGMEIEMEEQDDEADYLSGCDSDSGHYSDASVEDLDEDNEGSVSYSGTEDEDDDDD